VPALDPAELLERATQRQRGALARLISLVERGGEPAREVGRLTYPRAGSAVTLGITGSPGAGKSTLTGALVAVMRSASTEAAVLAIDPSSPFSGGAILGDRVRMQDHFLDPGVFIRSMATRGHLGGLALATPAAVRVLDAVGFPWVLIETVGVGQVEVEVAGAADTTVVVVNPGWGDSVQANKAGLLEVADVFVINKADRAGAGDTRRDLEQMLDLTEASGGWRPPILPAVGTTGQGVEELWKAVGEHQEHLAASGLGDERRATRRDEEVHRIVVETLADRAQEVWASADLAAMRAGLADRSIDPWLAADRILARV
jgi:LAO/AO transport system kinase